MFSSDENLSDHESLSDLSDLEEKPYFRKMDKFDTVEIRELPSLPDDDKTVELFDNSLREQYLKEGDEKKVLRDKKRDQTYREVLEWELKLPPQNKVIYCSDEVPEEPPVRSELVEMIMRSRRPEKCEFEWTPPVEIAGEGDKIMYPRGLHLSQNFTVLERCRGVKEEKKDEDKELKNGEIMVQEIGKLRAEIANFRRELEEFAEKSKFLGRAFQGRGGGEGPGNEIKLVQQGIVNQKKIYCFVKKYGNVNYNRFLGVVGDEEEFEEEIEEMEEARDVKIHKKEEPVQEEDQTRRQSKLESVRRILEDEKRILEEIKHFEGFRTTNCSLEMQMAND